MRFLLAFLLLATVAHADEYRRADRPWDWQFPRDHGSHPEFQTEWWYFTGNLATPAGRRFGFQVTFFRFALDGAEAQPPGHEGRGALVGQVVERLAVLAPDLDHVLEALGRDEGRLRPPARQQGVRRDGRAVGEAEAGCFPFTEEVGQAAQDGAGGHVTLGFSWYDSLL